MIGMVALIVALIAPWVIVAQTVNGSLLPTGGK